MSSLLRGVVWQAGPGLHLSGTRRGHDRLAVKSGGDCISGASRGEKNQWLSKAEYLDGEGIVLRAAYREELKPFLLALKKESARIPLLEILRLREHGFTEWRFIRCAAPGTAPMPAPGR